MAHLVEESQALTSTYDNALGNGGEPRGGNRAQSGSDAGQAELNPAALFDGLTAVETEKMEGLYNVFSPGDFGNLMEMVHRCIATETDVVELSVSEGNLSAAMMAAHKITGSSGNYAFIKVSKAAARVNDLLNNGGDAKAAIVELRKEADHAIADLNIILSRLA